MSGSEKSPKGGGNSLRAAVLGANDGLVSNLSLVMGVAGAVQSEKTLLLTGLAGLVAGACSMAMGEWLSVNSSRELYQKQIDIEKSELEHEREADHFAAEPFHEPGRGRGRAAGGDDVVDDERALAGRDRVAVDLQQVGSVFELVLLTLDLPRKLARLAERYQGLVHQVCQRRREQEPARFGRRDGVDRSPFVMLDDQANCFVKRAGVGQLGAARTSGASRETLRIVHEKRIRLGRDCL